MFFANIGIGVVLLFILNWFLSMMSFDGYLGKLISLILLVLIASRSAILGVVGVVLIIKKHGLSVESMTNSETKIHQETKIQQESRKADFKNAHCKKGKLMKEVSNISMEDLASAFPEIEFPDQKCNPCDEGCNFQIKSSNEKISDEEKLRPRNSKESFVSR
jgi:hypothetical protein